MSETNYLVPLNEAVEISGIEKSFIQRAAKEGLINYEIQSEKLYFSKDEIDLWVKKAPELANRLRTTKEKEYFRKEGFVPKSSYILPFKGPWLVGGPHLLHCTRYAWDFLVIAPEDYSKCYYGMNEEDILKLRLFRNKGKKNPKDFFCYQVDIVCPADGEVIRVKENFTNDDSEDYQGVITIDHGNGEISNLAHVLGRTIEVKIGDMVKQGQKLCLAGGKHGDGITQMPHLHWDIWDHPHFLFAKGIPLKISKAKVFTNGSFEERCDFFLTSGMLVKNI